MRKILLFIFTILSFSYAIAQNLNDGFYRVYNKAELRYIYITDNSGSAELNNIDVNAVELIVGRENTLSNPATVVYLHKVEGFKYDVQSQGTSVYQLIGHVPEIRWDERGQAYRVGAYYEGSQIWLGSKNNPTFEIGQLNTTGNNPLWIFESITAEGESFFGITPTVEVGDKYYQPFFAEFAFSFASSGMKAYYVSEMKEDQAKLVQITDDIIPEKTPVIIECSSKNPSDNRLNILAAGGNEILDNKLKGVYFCNEYRREISKDAVTRNDKDAMRVLGVTSDGKLGFITSNDKYIAANTFYLSVVSGTPATLEAVSDFTSNIVSIGVDNFRSGIYSILGEKLREGTSLDNLPAGIYIVNGKKIIKRN